MTAHDSAGIDQAVQHLVEALGSRSYLVGSNLTLVDLVIYTALFPVQVSRSCHTPQEPNLMHTQPSTKCVNFTATLSQVCNSHVHPPSSVV